MCIFFIMYYVKEGESAMNPEDQKYCINDNRLETIFGKEEEDAVVPPKEASTFNGVHYAEGPAVV